MMRGALLVWLLVAACDAPQALLRVTLSEGPAQECPSLDCNEIPMTCDSYISIRIIDPEVPETPFHSQCTDVRLNGPRTLCSIGAVELEPKELPLRDLEVQVAVYPASMITFDADGNAVCPTDVRYDASNGFPIPATINRPALGGRDYYHPGDETTVVTLGCTNLEAIHNETCVGTNNVHVSATVDDFDTRVSVGELEADRLSLSVGEPRTSGAEYVLNPSDVDPLDRAMRLPPAWATDLSHRFGQYACLAVLDDTPQSTTALTCKAASMLDEDVEFTSPPGTRLTKTALDQILAAVSLAAFPAEGITIGIVLDVNGNPRQGVTVVPSSMGEVTPTIRYLSSDRTTAGGTATSSGLGGGVWVSTDAPFGTIFSASVDTPPQTVQTLGGRIAGKVTIVVLRFRDPIVGG